MAALLEVKDVTLRYQTAGRAVTAVAGVSFVAEESDRFVLLGASGCGKSTLLKAIGGYLPLAAGEIRVAGTPVTRPGPDRVMVFQEFDQLLPWKTVRGNVIFGLTASGRLRGAEARERAEAAIARVKLTAFADAYPHTLSGGMKMRVALARALAMEPRVLLMDEPFASLDALTRSEMQAEIKRLWSETRFTMIFVTHSIREAVTVGSRVLVLSPHPGRVRAELSCGDSEAGSSAGLALEQRINDLVFGTAGAKGAAHGE